MERIIPDTSAVIIGAISEIIERNELDFPEIIVPEAVVCELEHQANANRSEGHRGLRELQKLQKLQDEGKLAVSFKGKRPTNYDIRYAKSGEIDGIIRDLARSEKGILVDCDMDAIILKISQTGAACHEGYRSCFFRKLKIL